jgi:hypothetical protein
MEITWRGLPASLRHERRSVRIRYVVLALREEPFHHNHGAGNIGHRPTPSSFPPPRVDPAWLKIAKSQTRIRGTHLPYCLPQPNLMRDFSRTKAAGGAIHRDDFSTTPTPTSIDMEYRWGGQKLYNGSICVELEKALSWRSIPDFGECVIVAAAYSGVEKELTIVKLCVE